MAYVVVEPCGVHGFFVDRTGDHRTDAAIDCQSCGAFNGGHGGTTAGRGNSADLLIACLGLADVENVDRSRLPQGISRDRHRAHLQCNTCHSTAFADGPQWTDD